MTSCIDASHLSLDIILSREFSQSDPTVQVLKYFEVVSRNSFVSTFRLTLLSACCLAFKCCSLKVALPQVTSCSLDWQQKMQRLRATRWKWFWWGMTARCPGTALLAAGALLESPLLPRSSPKFPLLLLAVPFLLPTSSASSASSSLLLHIP